MPSLLAVLSACYVSEAELFAALDHDGDGHVPLAVGGDDCDNESPDVHPGALERCGDDIDNDCDGRIDDRGEGETTFYVDADDDGWGTEEELLVGCAPPAGWAERSGDCAPDDPSRNPGATDLCDGVDQDCDSEIDEDATFSTWYPDADEDGLGAEGQGVEACERPDGHLTDAGDCDDTDPAVGMLTWFEDADEDGFGDVYSPFQACALPTGHVEDASDCDDLNNTVHPGAAEVCDNGVDEDCSSDAPMCGLGSYATLADGLASAGLSFGLSDLTGDGHADLFVNHGTHATVVAGGPSFRAAPAVAAATFTGTFGEVFQRKSDFDTDGTHDLFFLDDAAEEVLVHLGGTDWTGGASIDIRADAQLILTGEPTGPIGGELLASDLDCDGQNELVAEDEVGDGRIVLLEWSAGQASSQDAWARIVAGPAGPISPVQATDLTADGCPELVTFRSTGFANGEHLLFEGSIAGDLVEADALHTEVGVPYSPGDVSGDGVSDLMVGLPNGQSGSNFAGEAYLFFGPITGPTSLTSADAVLEGSGNQNAAFGPLSEATDLDADGVFDLIVGAPALSSAVDPGGLYVVLGPVTPGVRGLATEADFFYEAATPQQGIGLYSTAVDLDADGYDDLLVPEIVSETTYILFGGGI